MAITISMPQLGESIHEGTIERWLKQPGDSVQEFDPLLEVMTDKVSVEVPAPAAGRLVSLLVKEGDTVQSGAPIATLEEVGANGPAPAAADGSGQPAAGSGRPDGAAEPSVPSSSRADEHAQGGDGVAMPPPSVVREAEPQAGEPHRYSPAVRAIAAEHNLDLEKVTGTGTGGRVSRRDVLNFLENQGSVAAPPAPPATPGSLAGTVPPAAAPAATEPAAAPATQAEPPARPLAAATAAAAPAVVAPRPTAAASSPPRPAAPALDGDERVPLSTMRRLIAEHMSRSKQQVPHAWQAAEVDMSRVVAYRNLHKDEFRKREGVSLSYLPFIVKATTVCLRENPAVNASFDGDAIVRHRRINIGVAVGLEEGLVVPVLKDADGLSLAGLARGVADLAERARTRKLKPDDMQGGTFTVNNPGTFGSTLSYSIINAPQAGILTMEAVVDRVVVVDGMIAIRPIMFLCFSFDHRAIDGLQAARFLQGVRKRLEELDVESTELY